MRALGLLSKNLWGEVSKVGVRGRDGLCLYACHGADISEIKLERVGAPAKAKFDGVAMEASKVEGRASPDTDGVCRETGEFFGRSDVIYRFGGRAEARVDFTVGNRVNGARWGLVYRYGGGAGDVE